MVTAPEQLAAVLIEVADRQPTSSEREGV
jgi:hypothetical protein